MPKKVKSTLTEAAQRKTFTFETYNDNICRWVSNRKVVKRIINGCYVHLQTYWMATDTHKTEIVQITTNHLTEYVRFVRCALPNRSMSNETFPFHFCFHHFFLSHEKSKTQKNKDTPNIDWRAELMRHCCYFVVFFSTWATYVASLVFFTNWIMFNCYIRQVFS